MRETGFIKQNKEKWDKFEKVLKQDKKDPDELSQLFVEVTDDLSYSRTFYPNRSVRVYLNNLSQQVFYNIYKNKKGTTNRFVLYWREEVPMLIYESRYSFLVAFIFFMLAIGIGALSSAYDPDFPRVILGDSYVEMTMENIEKGDPMAVYKNSSELDMFLRITLNNLRVAFYTFIAGAFFLVGTLFVLLYNGIMVGSFQYFFYDQDVFMESFLTIWLHGTIEISSIIIAGAAGLTLGRGLIFPGTYSRIQAFQISARKGIKIMMSIVPLFIIAGFIEGYFTRHTDAPDIIRFGVILFSAAYILLYYVAYPWYKYKKGFTMTLKAEKLAPQRPQRINFANIKPAGEIFGDTFVFYKKHFRRIFTPSFILAGLATITVAILLTSNKTVDFDYETFQPESIFQYLDYPENIHFYWINTVVFAFITLFVNYLICEEAQHPKKNITYRLARVLSYIKGFFLQTLILVGLGQCCLFLPPALAILTSILVFPFVSLWIFVQYKEKVNPFKGLRMMFKSLNHGLARLLTIYLVLGLFMVIFFFLIESPVIFLDSHFVNEAFRYIYMNIPMEEESTNKLFTIFFTFVNLLATLLLLQFLTIGLGIFYYTQHEINYSTALLDRIKTFGVRS